MTKKKVVEKIFEDEKWRGSNLICLIS
jgi:hypothetical protein